MIEDRPKNLSHYILLPLCVLYLIIIYNLPFLNVISNFNILISYTGRFILTLVAFFLICDKNNISFLLKKRQYIFYLFSFIIVVLIGGFFNSDFTAMLNRIIFDILGCWVIYLSFMFLSKDPKNQKIFAWTLAILATINGIIGIYGALTGQKIVSVTPEEVGVGAFGFDLETGRSGGFRGENYTGAWNAPGLGLGLILFFGENYLSKFIGAFLTLIATISLVVSLSRTSIIAGSVLITVIITNIIGKKRITNLIIFSIFSFFLLKLAENTFIIQSRWIPPYTKYEIQRKWKLLEMLEDSRKYIWTEYLRTSLEMPIFGHGAGFIKEEFESGNQVPHNSFLDVLVEHGIVGLILYFFPFIISFRGLNLWNRNYHSDKMKIFYFGVFIAIAVSLQFLSCPFFKLLWLIMGCLEGTKRSYLHKISAK